MSRIRQHHHDLLVDFVFDRGRWPTFDNPALALGCRAAFASGQHAVEFIGRALEERAIAVHRGFWDR